MSARTEHPVGRAIGVALLVAAVLFKCLGCSSTKTVESTVLVICKSDVGRTILHGSGVIVSSGEGASTVVTAGHLSRAATALGATVWVMTSDGLEWEASIEVESSAADLALLSIPHEYDPASLSGDQLRTGDPIYWMGFPGVKRLAIHDGRAVGAFHLDGHDYLRLSTPANNGCSGGPVFNENGEVVGVVVLKWGKPDRWGQEAFAVPSDQVMSFLEENQIEH